MKRKSQVDESKSLVADAFLSLLRRKSYDDITLAEIADEAGVSRMTIHRHFKCKENIIKYQIKKVMAMMNVKSSDDEEQTLKSEILKKFTILKSLPHAKLLLQSDEITSIIYEIKRESKETPASKYIGAQADKYMFQFVKGGMDHMIKEWLKSDFDISPEEITDKTMKVLSLLCN